MQKEINMLNQVTNSPKSPFIVILGGAKVSDKISVIDNLKQKANTFVIGGGMAATFICALGYKVGKSSVETDYIKFAKDLILESQDTDFEIILPKDVIVSETFSIDSTFRTTLIDDVAENEMILDIGPQTSVLFAEAINESKTLLWNGPMGVFEFEQYSNGTKKIATKLSQLKTATTIVGGGSTSEIIRTLNLHEKVTHVSTGGGATLEFLGGEILPGISNLYQKDK
jgi:phosphoglycerate kinase